MNLLLRTAFSTMNLSIYLPEYTIGRHVDSWTIVDLPLEYSQILRCLIIDPSFPLPPCETGETINMNDSHNSDG